MIINSANSETITFQFCFCICLVFELFNIFFLFLRVAAANLDIASGQQIGFERGLDPNQQLPQD